MDSATAQKLFNAYRAGLLDKTGTDPRDYHPRYQVLLRHLVMNRLSLPERLPLRKVRHASSQGLRLAREGRLEAASKCLEAGREELERGADSPGRLMGRAVLESALAYLDFREERFLQARERLLAAMDIDLALEQDETFGLLQIHRIQSALNLMRLEFRTGRSEVAGNLGGNILIYLENLTDSLPIHHSWCPQTLLQSPRAIRLAMVTQVANEMALALPRTKNPSQVWNAFYNILDRQGSYFDLDPRLHLRVRQWIHLKRSFEQQNWDLYIPLLIDFLSAGKRDITPSWYSSVFDLLAFCRIADSGPSLQIRAAILRDSPKWRALPISFQACLAGNPD